MNTQLVYMEPKKPHVKLWRRIFLGERVTMVRVIDDMKLIGANVVEEYNPLLGLHYMIDRYHWEARYTTFTQRRSTTSMGTRLTGMKKSKKDKQPRGYEKIIKRVWERGK